MRMMIWMGAHIDSLARDWARSTGCWLSAVHGHRQLMNHCIFRWTNPIASGRMRCGDEARRVDRSIRLAAWARSAGGASPIFDEDWACSKTYTYGHDIEAAWLQVEAAEVSMPMMLFLGRPSWVELARSVLKEALDEDGGGDEGRDGEVTNPNREWWCQAEAVVGFGKPSSSRPGTLRRGCGTVWSFD